MNKDYRKSDIKMAIESLTNIATTDEIKSRITTTHLSDAWHKTNCHIHLPPNFSAFNTVIEAVQKASAEDIRVLGAGNYYDYSVYADFANLACRNGIYPLFGLEIICLIEDFVRKGIRVNDPANPGKFYICGKGITKFVKMSPRAEAILQKIRKSDSIRITEMANRLGDVFSEGGINLRLNYADIVEMVVRRHGCPKSTVYLQERHLAQVYQKIIFKQFKKNERVSFLEKIFHVRSKNSDDDITVQNEIRSHLLKTGKPAFVEESFIGFNEAYELIIELGGIPCYPVLADGANPICEYETPVENLIKNILSQRIYAVEYIPIRNKPEILEKYVIAMRNAGIIVTSGTEHNTLDMLPIEPKCIGNTPIPEKIKKIFYEGACVLIAHQFLTLNGETGFVDMNGNLNQKYENAEGRISAFSKIGSAVLEKFMIKYSAKQGA